MTAMALFCGDIAFDVALRVPHFADADQKTHAFENLVSAGGVAANSAVACARQGVTTALLAVVGDDVLGAYAIDFLAARGVDVTGVTTTPGMTAVSVCTLAEEDGEKRLVYTSSVSQYPPPERLRDAELDGVDWIHTSCLDPEAAAVLAERARAADIPRSIDLEPSALAHGAEALAPALYEAEVVFLNERATAEIGDIHAFCARHRLKLVVCTRGSHGAALTDGSSEITVAPPPTGPIVDTTGAGDCLAGVYIARSLSGSDPRSALRASVASATHACHHLGAQGGYPDRETTDELLANGWLREPGTPREPRA
ncbi:carbohydrate kinase family protein [Streptomyces sp. KM273126]|uniref:carbohydrate kinase family protein n=1 Tax=Streptomyces sp. KM273126 TaxID=2545247 RepID=UPI0014047E7F|nr:carbohydrate kinase family protein [Streptomyces sp. KM273126]MBA2807374.1 carbohydrate kinase family protein [Streptomyces sp. KM273126]